jgi:hypothetical protein
VFIGLLPVDCHPGGHTSIATTERYTAVDDDEMRAAMSARY